MFKNLTNSQRFPILRRLWKPAVVTSAGGTATAIWFEEILLFGEQILALIFLPIMAGIIYLLDILMFRSQTPRAEDSTNANEKKRS